MKRARYTLGISYNGGYEVVRHTWEFSDVIKWLDEPPTEPDSMHVYDAEIVDGEVSQ